MSLFQPISRISKNTVLRLSPWFLVGSAIILGAAITFWAVKNARTDRDNMSQNLADRAGALIWAMEAGARTGMGMNRAKAQLQSLLEETAKQPGILYLAITTADGMILADSERSAIGGLLYDQEEMQKNNATEKLQWHVTKEGGADFFEAYKIFSPLPGFSQHMSHGAMMGHERRMKMEHRPERWWRSSGESESQSRRKYSEDRTTTPRTMDYNRNNLVIFVGLDMGPFEKALENDLRNTIITALLVGLLAFGGFVSLFWAQSSRLSRRVLEDTRTFGAALTSSLPIGLVISDVKEQVVQINDMAADILTSTKTELLGRDLSALHGLHWAEIAARTVAGSPVLEEEHILCQQNGGEIPVSVSASRISNDEGVGLGMFFLLRDLREVKLLQEKLRRNERLSSLGNMAARVAHEIRNPLSSIKGYATYLGTRQEDADDKEAARIMIGEVERLNRVVSELLDFARPANLNIAPENVQQLLERVIRLAEMDASGKNISLRLLPLASPLWVAADAERITQAMLNLLLNSVQATEAGGSVTVAVALEAATAGEVERVRISLTDTGCGIPEDVLPQIFNPYFTTRATGTGLGLAITQKIIEDHQGSIKATSTVGQGTTITVWLPLATTAC